VGQNRDVHSILHLQRTFGNQAVLRFLQTATETIHASSANSASTGFSHDFSRIPVYPGTHNSIQPKLKVNPPRDRNEEEAGRIAEEVLRQKMPEQEDEKLYIQARASLPAAGSEREVHVELENRLNRSKGSGNLISDQARAFFEPRMQFDFSNVKVHTDNEAARMNQELRSRAFTYGRDIYFGVGQYNPQSIEGKRLLAHELTHVVQQRGKESNKAAGNTTMATVQQVLPPRLVARSWTGPRPRGEPERVAGGLPGYVRRIRSLLLRGSRTPLNLTGVLEPRLRPMRQRTRFDSPGQPNREDAQDLQQFFAAYEGGVSAFVEQLAGCLEVMARVSGRAARFRGETEEQRRASARAWLVDFTDAIARTYPPITAAAQGPATRIFDVARAGRERQLAEGEETRREAQDVNRLIGSASVEAQWLGFWRRQFSSPGDNQERLARWLLDRWNHSEINTKLRTARWAPNRDPARNQEYRRSFAVFDEVGLRLGITRDDGRAAGISYFNAVYGGYHDELLQLGCDLVNYLLPGHSTYLARGAYFNRPAFVTRMEAWERLSAVPTPSALPHHSRIRQIWNHFDSYRGRTIPGHEFAWHMVFGSHTYPSGIHCDTNGCRFPSSAVPR
jgi:hypothetical protein